MSVMPSRRTLRRLSVAGLAVLTAIVPVSAQQPQATTPAAPQAPSGPTLTLTMDQAVQMALHPHALNGYQALAKFLHRTGAATQGDSMLQGVKLVRGQLRDQMRKSGMLGGPDYSDPDEVATKST